MKLMKVTQWDGSTCLVAPLFISAVTQQERMFNGFGEEVKFKEGYLDSRIVHIADGESCSTINVRETLPSLEEAYAKAMEGYTGK